MSGHANELSEALGRCIDGGPLDGMRFGDLIFSADRNIALLREIAATGAADARAAATAVLTACRIPVKQLDVELLDSARAARRPKALEGDQ